MVNGTLTVGFLYQYLPIQIPGKNSRFSGDVYKSETSMFL